MRLPKNLPTPRTIVYLTLFLTMIASIPALVFAAQYGQPLSVDVLEQKALEAAHRLGFQGQPAAQTSKQMTMEKWFALMHNAIASTADHDAPVFVLSVQGEATNPYNNLTIAVDGVTGDLFMYTTQYFDLDTMDLNALPAPDVYVLPAYQPLPPHILTAKAVPYPFDRLVTPAPEATDAVLPLLSAP